MSFCLYLYVLCIVVVDSTKARREREGVGLVILKFNDSLSP